MDLSNDSLCRFCLQTTEHMEEIFNSHVEYIKELEEFTGIKIIDNEIDFPSLICEECQKIVEIIRNFRNKCRRTEELLRQINTTKFQEIKVPETKYSEIDIEDTKINIKSEIPLTDRKELEGSEDSGTDDLGKKKVKEKGDSSDVAETEIQESQKLERKYKKYFIACHICGKQYESSRLKYHINKHNGHRPYVCDYEDCGKAFPSPFLLKSHNKICHTDFYPFACDICGRQFKVRTTFLVHRSYHLDPEIPCTVCGKLLRNNRALKKHMMSHTGERPFSCDMCPKSFQNKYTLKVHQRVHTKEKPFMCGKCGQSFGYKCLLKAHISKQHPDDTDLVIL